MAETPKPTERQARTPLPREDGEDKKPGLRTPRMRILLIIAALLAANYILMAVLAPGRVEPVRVPYNPTFLEQVRDGNVERISTQGTTVDGKFKKEVRYGDADPNTSFETEIPIFANDEQLSKL